jgi:mono/diheme cytochrome c family protein
LSDGVTWIFPDGPRQTIPLDSFFAKDNPDDQRISNWSAVRGSITDFNNNSRAVQGGDGFAGVPPNPNIYNHGITQGGSDALDAQTLWVQTVRAPLMPPATDAAAQGRGAAIFNNRCASCHGGAKWSKSQVIYRDDPAFTRDAAAGGVPTDPGVTSPAAGQIQSFTVGGVTLTFLESVGTFSAANPLEIRGVGGLIGRTGLGSLGFNVPSLLGIGYHAPYLHHGAAQTLSEVFTLHGLEAGTIATTLSAAERADLAGFLRSIDGRTPTFRSQTDDFRDTVALP